MSDVLSERERQRYAEGDMAIAVMVDADGVPYPFPYVLGYDGDLRESGLYCSRADLEAIRSCIDRLLASEKP